MMVRETVTNLKCQEIRMTISKIIYKFENSRYMSMILGIYSNVIKCRWTG